MLASQRARAASSCSSAGVAFARQAAERGAQQARRVLQPLGVAAQPEQIFHDAARHAAPRRLGPRRQRRGLHRRGRFHRRDERTQVSLLPPP